MKIALIIIGAIVLLIGMIIDGISVRKRRQLYSGLSETDTEGLLELKRSLEKLERKTWPLARNIQTAGIIILVMGAILH